MSLATRCTACGTIFRVVQDQLRVSEGWVRCGRCAEVFDAREQLFDIDREAPPPWPSDIDEIADEPVPEDMPAAAAEAAMSARSWPLPEEELPPSFVEPEAEPMAPSVPAFIAEPVAAPDARQEPRWMDEETAPSPQAPERMEPPAIAIDDGPDVVLAPHLADISEAAEPPLAPMPMPEFMRRANGRQRWQRPGVRIALGLSCLLMLGLLGLQLAHHFRDAIVAIYPQARPGMQALCELSGCELRPWQRIDALSVENSALSQAGAPNQYRLTISLRNKSAVAVALPWIELNLTDAAGTVVLRRMLAPGDFKSDKPTPTISVAPGAELPLHLLLSTGEQRVSGYSVEIFHP